jgi:hypothetical protein
MPGLLVALAAAALQAQPAAPDPLAGIWEGNVGSLPVRACFVGPEEGAFGAYYYRSRMQLIALEAVAGERGGYREGAGGGAGAGTNAARWRIERVGGDRLIARWTSGRRALPVRLRRVAQPNEEGPCDALAFHRPRLAGVNTIRTRETADGVAYTKLRLEHGGRFGVSVATFALDGDSPAVRRVNATLGAPLSHDPPEWLDCIRGPLANGPYEGDYQASLEPVMLSRRWLSVADRNGGSCGGAHPYENNNYRTFDLTSGAEIDLHDWLNPDAVKRERLEGSNEVLKSLQPAFRTFILSGWRGDEGCDEVVRTADFWTIGLTREGLVFTPSLPHAMQACFEEFSIGFDQLRPYFTRDGAANVSALRAERR